MTMDFEEPIFISPRICWPTDSLSSDLSTVTIAPARIEPSIYILEIVSAWMTLLAPRSEPLIVNDLIMPLGAVSVPNRSPPVMLNLPMSPKALVIVALADRSPLVMLNFLISPPTVKVSTITPLPKSPLLMLADFKSSITTTLPLIRLVPVVTASAWTIILEAFPPT